MPSREKNVFSTASDIIACEKGHHNYLWTYHEKGGGGSTRNGEDNSPMSSSIEGLMFPNYLFQLNTDNVEANCSSNDFKSLMKNLLATGKTDLNCEKAPAALNFIKMVHQDEYDRMKPCDQLISIDLSEGQSETAENRLKKVFCFNYAILIEV